MGRGDARAVCIRVASDAKVVLDNAVDVFFLCPMEHKLERTWLSSQHAGKAGSDIEITHVYGGIRTSGQLLTKCAYPIHDTHRYGIWRVLGFFTPMDVSCQVFSWNDLLTDWALAKA